jgi:curved DNA-binding protein
VDDINDMFGGGLGGCSDFFNAFFGGGRPRPQRRTTTNNARRTSQPQVYQQPVTISFLEAYNGTTRLLQFDNKKIEVKIPAGVKTGSKVRVSGAGPQQANGGRADIFLLITVAKDEHFEISGNDLNSTVTVDLFTAILGGENQGTYSHRRCDPKNSIRDTAHANLPPERARYAILKQKGSSEIFW